MSSPIIIWLFSQPSPVWRYTHICSQNICHKSFMYNLLFHFLNWFRTDRANFALLWYLSVLTTSVSNYSNSPKISVFHDIHRPVSMSLFANAQVLQGKYLPTHFDDVSNSSSLYFAGLRLILHGKRICIDQPECFISDFNPPTRFQLVCAR